MTRQTELRDEDMHAFIDGELDDAGRAKVEAAIADDLALAGMVASYRTDMARIAAVYGDGLKDPLPRRWIAMIENDMRRPQWRSMGVAAMALAASVLLVFGLTISFRQSAAPVPGDIVADALAARANEVGPQTIISVRSPADAQLQNVAMAKALATRVMAPNLSRMGYQLIAIETYDSPSLAFELVYRDRKARVFTLYLRRSSGAPRIDQFAEKGLRICVWQDDVVGMVMAGQMSTAEMQHLAIRAYDGLTGL
jgi:anti-sigma factor RsiW